MGIQNDERKDHLVSVLALDKAVKLYMLCSNYLNFLAIIRVTERTKAPIEAEQNVQIIFKTFVIISFSDMALQYKDLKNS